MISIDATSEEDFKRNKEIKRKYIEIIKQIITEEKLNINLNIIESTEKYGKLVLQETG